MPVQIGARGQPGFDRPIDLMIDCHRRIEGFLGVVERVADRFAGGSLDEPASRALREALRYFREGAPNHTADEEHSLFPELRALNRPEVTALLDAADMLEAEHRQAEAIHNRVNLRLERWLEDGSLETAVLEGLRRDTAALIALYREHIALEEQTLFPAAAEALDGPALARIGRAMAARRGLGRAGTGLATPRTTNPEQRR